MELKQIRLVLTLARHRHFGRAALELGLSQSALSKSLQALEHEIGSALFHRGPGEVSPTAFGEAIVERGAGVLGDVDEIELELTRLRGLQVGRVRFGVGPAHAEDPVGTALGRFVDAHPRIQVETVVASYDELLRRLHRAELDFCVVTLSASERGGGLSITKLAPRRMVYSCRAGHPLAGEGPTDYRELLAYPLVTLPHLPAGRRFLQRLAGSGPDVPPAIEIADRGMIRAVLLSSNAIAIGARSYLDEPRAAEGLVTLRVRGDLCDARGGPCGAIVARTDRALSAAAEALMREVVACDAEVVSSNPDWIAAHESRVFAAVEAG